MSDINKTVAVRFKVDGLDAINKQMAQQTTIANRAANALGAMQRQMSSLGRLATTGIMGYGLFQLGKGLINVNAQAETTAIGIATMYQSADRMRGRILQFTPALGEAQAMLAGLRKEAVETPGTLADVTRAFMAVGMQARVAGLSAAQVQHLSGNIATKESFLGAGVVSTDVAQLLRGDASKMATPQLESVKAQVAALAKHGKRAEAFSLISQALEMDPAARKAFGDSFEGQLSTFKDQITEIQRIAGKPLFEVANKALKDMSAWLVKNHDKVASIAKAIGEGIVKAIKAVGSAFEWLNDHGLLEATVGAAGIVKAFGSLAPILTALAKNPLFAAIGLAAAAYALLTGKDTDVKGYMAAYPQAGAAGGGEGGLLPPADRLRLDVGGGAGWQRADMSTVTDPRGRAFKVLQSELDHLERLQDNVGYRNGSVYQAVTQMALNARARAFPKDTSGSPAVLKLFPDLSQTLAFAGKSDVNIDARGSRISVEQNLSTDDPSRLAGATLAGAFGALVRRPLSANLGLGSVGVATGG